MRRLLSSKYLGAQNAPFTSTLSFTSPQSIPIIPIYRVIDESGNLVNSNHTINISDDKLVKMYHTMTELSVMDQLFYDAQRQGRMSFYMTNIGEEAEQVGSSAATEISDVMFGQYREAGAFLWRGFTMDQVADQLFSNQFGHGKGRQMPVHYGSKELNIQTISSPLATQIPQATGAAYALKLNGAQNCVICYFGDGAASEGDFHAALNFAATLECPVLFFCRNNGIAISTQVKEQYRGDGIASRAAGYGMDAIRVDGNDLFAVYEATKAAREKCVSESRPILIEAMSYRGGHHSTSDDSTRYRSIDEISHWREHNNPITRVRLYMEAKGIWNNDKETDLRVQCRKKVLQAISRAEAIPKPSVEELFNDVLDEHSYQLKQQREELKDHLKLYPDKYQTELYESSLK